MNRLEEHGTNLPERLQAAVLTAFLIHPKSVWLCSSHAEAGKYKDAVSQWLNDNGLVGHPTWLLTSLGDEIDKFKASPTGHLFVGGRFDGMDFKADECRLVVLTTLPRAINAQEEFISAYLRDAGFMRRRLNQRVVQALGRCNRDEDDFGMYVLADRRFATYFGRDSNRESIPDNMVAEIDMAQDHAEIGEKELCDRVRSFLMKDWNQYDSELLEYRKLIPASTPSKLIIDTSANEVFGWATLFANQNYDLAADRFEQVWDACQKDNLLETGAFWKFNWAKAVYLQSLMGNPAALDKALDLLDQAIKRGGVSSWFNRLRASLNRARAGAATAVAIANDEYSSALTRSFDDHLEQLGTKGTKFESFCTRISACLASDKHGEFCEGLERLGIVLGYQASRPKHKAATDNLWRGTFGNVKEVVTFEAKVEHSDGKEVTPAFVGQAHNQMNRAIAEYQQLGYTVCGTITTHLEAIDPSAKSSLGSLRIVTKTAVQSLWDRVRLLFSLYRDGWSLDDVNARLVVAAALRPKCPAAGWLVTTLQQDTVIIGAVELLARWPQ